MAGTYTTNGATSGQAGPSKNLEYTNTKRVVLSNLTESSATIAAAITLSENQSGSVIMLDRLAGATITLPVATNPGITYEFVTTRGVTSNSYKVITNLNVASAIITGSLLMTAASATSLSVGSMFISSTGANVAITSNGSTTGGLQGGRFTITSLSVGTWFVSGNLVGSGAFATPFATS